MRTVGFLKTSEGSKYLLCDGSQIPSSYSKLRTLMTHTPDLRDRVPQGAGAYAVNTKIEAAIPNISGGLGGPITAGGYSYVVSGPFYTNGATGLNGIYQWSGSYNNRPLFFDASRCSSIYKDDCNTVQPPALALNFYIKAK